jgi:hypothetical protein
MSTKALCWSLAGMASSKRSAKDGDKLASFGTAGTHLYRTPDPEKLTDCGTQHIGCKVFTGGTCNMERETGLEPATSSLGSWRSATELLPLTSYYMCYTSHLIGTTCCVAPTANFSEAGYHTQPLFILTHSATKSKHHLSRISQKLPKPTTLPCAQTGAHCTYPCRHFYTECNPHTRGTASRSIPIGTENRSIFPSRSAHCTYR